MLLLAGGFHAVAWAQHPPLPDTLPASYFERPVLDRLSTDRATKPLSVTTTGSPAPTYTSFLGDHNSTPANPPDPQGAAGPRGILGIDNAAVAYYAKYGALYWSVSALTAFFSATAQPTGACLDPRAVYDAAAGRFYVMTLQVPLAEIPGVPHGDLRGYVQLAVSRSSHPVTPTAADWYFYRFDVTEVVGGDPYAMDYPGLGYDADAIYVTGNVFSLPMDRFASNRRAQILVIHKALALSGVGSAASVFTPVAPLEYFSLQPATVTSVNNPGAIAYFAEVRFTGPSNLIRLWALSDPLGARTLTSTMLTVPDYGTPPAPPGGAAQCDTSAKVETLGRRAQGNAFWYDGSLWFCHTGVTGVTPTVFYQRVLTNSFPAGVPSTGESGVITGWSGAATYQPAIGCNALGDIGIVYTQSDAVTCPIIMFTTRRHDESSFAPPQVLKTSVTHKFTAPPDGRVRWGDYATVSGDPIDQSLWFSHERVGPPIEANQFANWDTWWGNVWFPDGRAGWPEDGLVVRTGQSPASGVRVAADGTGASLFAFTDNRDGPIRAYAAKRNADGSVPNGWLDRGVLLSGPGAPAKAARVDPVSVGAHDRDARMAPASDATDATLVGLVPDGSGGGLAGWVRLSGQLRVQRMTSAGTLAAGWPVDGVLVATSSTGAVLMEDGAGGAILARSASGVRLHRLAADGTLLWGGTGVSVSTSGTGPAICSDGSGGVIVVWAQSGVLRAQRLTAAGAPLWTAGGASLGTGRVARVAADGSGGALILFARVDSLLALRITSDGQPAAGWPAQGAPVCMASNGATEWNLVGDGSGGMVAAWVDQRDALDDANIYALRLTGSGSRATGWPVDGSPVCLASGVQSHVSLTADGAGGAIITWQDRRANPGCEPTSGCGDDVYALHLLANGSRAAAFPADGLAVSAAPGDQVAATVAVTSGGKATIAWLDGRIAPDCIPDCTVQVFAQQLTFDPLAPAAVTDLRLDSGSSNLIARWTLPGDDGMSGTAAAYDLRYATFPLDEGNFLQASSRTGPIGDPAGTPICVSVEPLPRCRNHYVAVRIRDEAGNWSPISNLPSIGTSCSGSTLAECPSNAVRLHPAEPEAPATVEFSAPYPNPTRSSTRFVLGIPAERSGSPLDIGVFDITGRRIAELARGPARGGYATVIWNVQDDSGREVPGGVYFVRLRIGQALWTRPVIVR